MHSVQNGNNMNISGQRIDAHNNYSNTDEQVKIDQMLMFDKSIHVSAVSSGAVHTCALRRFGELNCWGWDDHRQVTIPHSVVTEEGELEEQDLNQILQVHAGYAHTCAINYIKCL